MKSPFCIFGLAATEQGRREWIDPAQGVPVINILTHAYYGYTFYWLLLHKLGEHLIGWGATRTSFGRKELSQDDRILRWSWRRRGECPAVNDSYDEDCHNT